MSAAAFASSAITLGCARSAAARAVSRTSGAATDAGGRWRGLWEEAASAPPMLDLLASRSKGDALPPSAS